MLKSHWGILALGRFCTLCSVRTVTTSDQYCPEYGPRVRLVSVSKSLLFTYIPMSGFNCVLTNFIIPKIHWLKKKRLQKSIAELLTSTLTIAIFSHRWTPTTYIYLLHIMCGYQCDKAMTKTDTREVI